MDKKRIKTAQTNLRLEPNFKAAAERAVKDDHRSLTSLIEKLLTDHLRRKGYLGETFPDSTRGTRHPCRVKAEGRTNLLGFHIDFPMTERA